MASFMSGMAGNVTAFNTVLTYDIYQSYIRPGSDRPRITCSVGQLATVFGIAASMAAAYFAAKFNNIMDLLQLVFGFVNAPLFATFLLGMFWRRATGHGAFFGLLGGTLAATIHHGLTLPVGVRAWASKAAGSWHHAVTVYPSDMAQSFWTAIYAFCGCFVGTVIISILTTRTKTDNQLRGLVYSLTPKELDESKYSFGKPEVLGLHRHDGT